MTNTKESPILVCLLQPNKPETQTCVSQQVLVQPGQSQGLGHTLHFLLSQHR